MHWRIQSHKVNMEVDVFTANAKTLSFNFGGITFSFFFPDDRPQRFIKLEWKNGKKCKAFGKWSDDGKYTFKNISFHKITVDDEISTSGDILSIGLHSGASVACLTFCDHGKDVYKDVPFTMGDVKIPKWCHKTLDAPMFIPELELVPVPESVDWTE